MADKKLGTLSEKHKEALSLLTSRPEFAGFMDFLKVQQNNIAIFEWFRLPYTDPDLKAHKAYYQGEVDIIKMLIKTFTDLQKSKEE